MHFNANSDFGLTFASSVAKCHSMVPMVMKLILHYLETAIFDLITKKKTKTIDHGSYIHVYNLSNMLLRKISEIKCNATDL